MLAQTSLQLIKELKRSQQSKLPAYNEDKIRVCLEEMRTLYDANYRDVALVSSSASEASSSSLLSGTEDHSNKIQSVLVRHAVLERNKRCLLAYHHARLMRIAELRWEYGIILPKVIYSYDFECRKLFYSTWISATLTYRRNQHRSTSHRSPHTLQ
ncbi:unnamed protein product [Heterobilharzia americana]|nr:unnamed protein product [Heterobilharzia americana]